MRFVSVLWVVICTAIFSLPAYADSFASRPPFGDSLLVHPNVDVGTNITGTHNLDIADNAKTLWANDSTAATLALGAATTTPNVTGATDTGTCIGDKSGHGFIITQSSGSFYGMPLVSGTSYTFSPNSFVCANSNGTSWSLVGYHGSVTTTISEDLLSGGSTMQTGWKQQASTFTPNAIADPLGDNTTAATLVEDTSDGQHYIDQTVYLATTSSDYTLCVWYKPGASNNRQLQLSVRDSFSNNDYFGADFDKDTGGTANSFANGDMTYVSSTLAQTVGSFKRLCVTGNVASHSFVVPTLKMIETDDTGSYTGDGTSSIQLWGPTLRKGDTP